MQQKTAPHNCEKPRFSISLQNRHDFHIEYSQSISFCQEGFFAFIPNMKKDGNFSRYRDEIPSFSFFSRMISTAVP